MQVDELRCDETAAEIGTIFFRICRMFVAFESVQIHVNIKLNTLTLEEFVAYSYDEITTITNIYEVVFLFYFLSKGQLLYYQRLVIPKIYVSYSGIS